jgi:hypothetical protein
VKLKYKETYRETYRPREAWVRKDKLPTTLPHLCAEAQLEAIELRAAGHCELDGRKMEFQDLRVYSIIVERPDEPEDPQSNIGNPRYPVDGEGET